MMLKLGFHSDWVVLIMQCVSSVSYTIGINDSISDCFSPSKGLRQGNPLSHYLFLIYAEGRSLLLNEVKMKRTILGAPIGRDNLTINHLLFVDDYILFGDASVDGAHVVPNIINEYELILGQQVNFNKSFIYYEADVSQNVRDAITNILKVRVDTNLEKYLGLPMMVERNKRWAFSNFVDRFRQRIENWSF
ncbi:hypothetical protein PVK06_028694 [Gossypium arboreum]|uniref:Reverse transcriptase n=1 Tax=Gossypium arboreum TaxID=29729 RepID=A0ABR0P4J8_GOSAR|nr:hypothetical protein PVK06_028694 [Gossypium arboreum]